jgi:hypothetical protein
MTIGHKWFLFKAIILIQIIRFHIILIGYKSVMSVLNRLIPKKKIYNNNSLNLAYYNSIINRVYKLPTPFCNCLAVSVGFGFILRKKGINTEIIIGVKTETTTIRSHAWLEYNGIQIPHNANNYKEFTPFSRVSFVST